MVEYLPVPPMHDTRFLLYEEGEISRAFNPHNYGHHIEVTLYPVVATPSIYVEGITYRPESWMIYCQGCGHLWARRINTGSYGTENWTVRNWPCRTCGHGSLWDHHNKPWNQSLPIELLHRELEIIQGWYQEEGITTQELFFKHKYFRRAV